jgi:DNA-binding GntR family transcriptional regulator
LLGDYLLQRLQQDIDGTLQLRLFRCLRNAIIDSVLAPKTRLPASRDLAKEIKVSRNTVLSAYEQLQAQGYVEARTGQGTWVAEKLPESFLVKAENTNSQTQEKRPSKIIICRNAVPISSAIQLHHLTNGARLCPVHPMSQSFRTIFLAVFNPPQP